MPTGGQLNPGGGPGERANNSSSSSAPDVVTAQSDSTAPQLSQAATLGVGPGGTAGTPTTPPAECLAFRRAIDNHQVTFHQVARAWFQSSPKFNPSAEDRPFYAELFPELLDEFGRLRGGIVTGYFCENIRVAAVLTNIKIAAELTEGPRVADLVSDNQADGAGSSATAALPGVPRRSGSLNGQARWERKPRGERRSASSSAIHLEPAFGDPESWKAKAMLFRCLELHYRALEFLKPKPRKISMRMVFSVIAALLGSLDARAARGEGAKSFGDDVQELEAVEEELARAERYYVRSAQRAAQVEYFLGMLGGLAVLLAVAVGLAAGLRMIGDLDLLLVSLLSGGCGGLLSVMSRMSAGKLALNHESGKGIIRLLGGMRPLIGAVFGVALYVLLEGGLLSLAPANGSDPVYFYAGVAFVAGFSERFAQDAVAGVGRGLSAAGPEHPAEAGPEPASVGPGGARLSARARR